VGLEEFDELVEALLVARLDEKLVGLALQVRQLLGPHLRPSNFESSNGWGGQMG
jgi:hypothetical protein